MSSSLERGFDKSLHNSNRLFLRRITRRDTEDIGIVVFTSKSGNLRSPGERCADARVFVGRHSHTIGCGTKKHTILCSSRYYILAYRMCWVWIIHGFCRVCSVISDFISFFLEEDFYCFFVSISCMIGTERENHKSWWISERSYCFLLYFTFPPTNV